MEFCASKVIDGRVCDGRDHLNSVPLAFVFVRFATDNVSSRATVIFESSGCFQILFAATRLNHVSNQRSAPRVSKDVYIFSGVPVLKVTSTSHPSNRHMKK